ncbi:hypothetical protein [Rhizobium sp. IMFF44]|uniref:hypothetical protein n=1 Tax=Rhizobium sp. IMFF44 TaxID=3342350 RepID=UPI0035B93CB9
MTSTELLEEYEANRQAEAALQQSDRDGIETVMKYAAGNAAARATIDLSAVRSDARLTLLTMDDHELKALASAGAPKVRQWIKGKDHGIFGIPAVMPSKTIETRASSRPPNMSPQEQMVWRIQAHVGKPDHSKEFKRA